MGRKPIPFGVLTETDKETILAYVRNNLSYTETGKEFHYGANTIYERMRRIYNKTGLNSNSFLDLCRLYQRAGGEIPKETESPSPEIKKK